MSKRYVTFGQVHTHSINGLTFDKDCVAVIHGDEQKVFDLFGRKFCTQCEEAYWSDRVMKYFPRGYIEVQ